MPPRKTKRMPKPTLDNLAKAICTENIAGKSLTDCFKSKKLSCDCAESTKWKRLTYVFNKYQRRTASSSSTFLIIEYLMNPVNFIGKETAYRSQISEINKILITEGYELDLSGKVHRAERVTSLDKIEEKYNRLVTELNRRCVHSEVLKYCKKELLQENYFHSVFEAAKGLSDRVREISGVDEDGTNLYNAVFSIKNPILQLNELSTDSLRNQQNGFKEMLNGITHYVRNVNAHEPRIKWVIEESEAVNVLMTISFLHSMLDLCVRA